MLSKGISMFVRAERSTLPELPEPAIDGRYWDPWRDPLASAFIGPWGFSSADIDGKYFEKDAFLG